MSVEHKEATEVTEAPAKTLKLSEAIRIGAKLRPQHHGALFAHGASCAMGAAYEARFGTPGPEAWLCPLMTGCPHEEMIQSMEAEWPFLLRGNGGTGLFGEITSLNDSPSRGMTREQIADWLEAQGL